MNKVFRLLVLISIITSNVHAADTDGDGMDDAWEDSMGLNKLDPLDAYTDKDGDGVPNLWEFARATAANDSQSFPAFDAVVCSNPDPNATPPQFYSLQTAYDSLPTTAGGRYLVQIKRGTYDAILFGGDEPRKVAWIGEKGANRMTGEESAILVSDGYDASLAIYDDTVIDGVAMDGNGMTVEMGVSHRPAIECNRTTTAPVVVRLVNSIIRSWNAWILDADWQAGAIQNNGTKIWLDHCTIWRSEGHSDASGSDLPVNQIYNTPGLGSELHLTNSILWDPNCQNTSGAIGGDIQAVWALNSVLQSNGTTYGLPGQLLNVINADPGLTNRGFVASGSPPIGAGVFDGVTTDFHGQARSLSSVDIGADQWVDTDSDGLPDWWEQFWFGSLAQTATGDPDFDGYENQWEYQLGLAPVIDQEADGLPDEWERNHFGSIAAMGPSDDPDGDGATNLEELRLGTNPQIAESFAGLDIDHDFINDLTEVRIWGNITAQAGWDDFDNDGLVNAAEINIYGSDPTNPDSNGDGILDGQAAELQLAIVGFDLDGDGLTATQELALGTNPYLWDTDGDGLADNLDPLPLVSGGSTPISVAGPPIITLITPPNATLVP